MQARASLLNCKQGQNQSTDEYMEEMRTWIDNIEYHGGTISESYTLVAEIDTNGNQQRTVEARSAMARDRTIATVFIRNADPTRYGTLITELSNQYARGKDEYSTDLTSAYGLLVNYTTPANTSRGGGGGAKREPKCFPPYDLPRNYRHDFRPASRHHCRDQWGNPRGNYLFQLQQHGALLCRLPRTMQ